MNVLPRIARSNECLPSSARLPGRRHKLHMQHIKCTTIIDSAVLQLTFGACNDFTTGRPSTSNRMVVTCMVRIHLVLSITEPDTSFTILILALTLVSKPTARCFL